jgi:predicted nicotinamide N-methyase
MNKITMQVQTKLLAAVIVLLIAGVEGSLVLPAKAGEIELNDIQNAKLARHKARERVMKNEKQEDYLDDSTPGPSAQDDEDCGTVDIGNVINNKGFGGPKAIDVIITGDIINANNDCN